MEENILRHKNGFIYVGHEATRKILNFLNNHEIDWHNLEGKFDFRKQCLTIRNGYEDAVILSREDLLKGGIELTKDGIKLKRIVLELNDENKWTLKEKTPWLEKCKLSRKGVDCSEVYLENKKRGFTWIEKEHFAFFGIKDVVLKFNLENRIETIDTKEKYFTWKEISYINDRLQSSFAEGFYNANGDFTFKTEKDFTFKYTKAELEKHGIIVETGKEG